MNDPAGSNIKNRDFYRNKRVFVTGHSGYKGAWLTAILNELDADTTGYALAAPPESLFHKINGPEIAHSIVGDIRDSRHLTESLLAAQPEIVLHLAAQAIVKDCYENPLYTYESNVIGTVNLLEAIRQCPSVKSVVIITTDKVYENKGDGSVYQESDPLGGTDPYSCSKTCVEYVTESYKRTYLQTEECTIGVSTVRASNVLGGGDHVQSRLIPSILHSISSGKPVELRNPNQTRPWQSIMDALNGYLTIGRLMYGEPEKYSSQWNIGPSLDGIRDVLWVFNKMREHYAGTDFVTGNGIAVVESQTLGLDIDKALRELDWMPLLSCDKMLYNVVEFFKLQRTGIPEREICRKQIREFFEMDGRRMCGK